VCFRGIARIRRYYSTLAPDAAYYFPAGGTEGADAQTMLGVTYGRSALWFTTASTIGIVNAALGGTMVALLVEGVLQLPRAVALTAAVVVALGLAIAVVSYERRRFASALG